MIYKEVKRRPQLALAFVCFSLLAAMAQQPTGGMANDPQFMRLYDMVGPFHQYCLLLKDLKGGISKKMIEKQPDKARELVCARIGRALWFCFLRLDSGGKLNLFPDVVKRIGKPDPNRFLKCEGAHNYTGICHSCFFAACRFCFNSTGNPGWDSCNNPACIRKAEIEQAAAPPLQPPMQVSPPAPVVPQPMAPLPVAPPPAPAPPPTAPPPAAAPAPPPTAPPQAAPQAAPAVQTPSPSTGGAGGGGPPSKLQKVTGNAGGLGSGGRGKGRKPTGQPQPSNSPASPSTSHGNQYVFTSQPATGGGGGSGSAGGSISGCNDCGAVGCKGNCGGLFIDLTSHDVDIKPDPDQAAAAVTKTIHPKDSKVFVIPEDWEIPDPSKGEEGSREECVIELSKDSIEYKMVEKELRAGADRGSTEYMRYGGGGGHHSISYVKAEIQRNPQDWEITKVFRIQNATSYIHGETHAMKLKARGAGSIQRILAFHGTDKKSAHENIAKEGFNRNFTKNHAYGRATYHARATQLALQHALLKTPQREDGCIVVSEIIFSKIGVTDQHSLEPPPGCDLGGCSNGPIARDLGGPSNGPNACILASFNDNQAVAKYIAEFKWTGPRIR